MEKIVQKSSGCCGFLEHSIFTRDEGNIGNYWELHHLLLKSLGGKDIAANILKVSPGKYSFELNMRPS